MKLTNLLKKSHFLTALIVAAPLATAPLAQEPASPAPASDEKAFVFPKEGETLRALKMDEIKEMVKNHNSELLVVNFWATWCAPCVAELPYFAAADQAHRDKGVRFVGLSLDNFTYDDWQEISAGTMKERGVKYANFAVDADTEDFVPYFADEWAGAIPATFYFDREGNKVGQRLREVTREELEADIQKYTPKKEAAAKSPESGDQSSSSTEKS